MIVCPRAGCAAVCSLTQLWRPLVTRCQGAWLALTTPVPLVLGEGLESFLGALCILCPTIVTRHLHPSARVEWN